MKTLVFLVLVTAVVAATLQVRYGAGEPYPDLGGEALLAEETLETVLSYPEPIGNVAVTDGGRLFFTVHPESRPTGNRLLEWINGAAEPYPNGSVQQSLFRTVLGLYIDRQERLWSIDHGNHGFGDARLLAFDLATDELVFDQTLSRDIAPAGSMLQDLRVSHDGRWVFIADASIWLQRPAIIVYDTQTHTARRARVARSQAPFSACNCAHDVHTARAQSLLMARPSRAHVRPHTRTRAAHERAV